MKTKQKQSNGKKLIPIGNVSLGWLELADADAECGFDDDDDWMTTIQYTLCNASHIILAIYDNFQQ